MQAAEEVKSPVLVRSIYAGVLLADEWTAAEVNGSVMDMGAVSTSLAAVPRSFLNRLAVTERTGIDPILSFSP